MGGTGDRELGTGSSMMKVNGRANVLDKIVMSLFIDQLRSPVPDPQSPVPDP